MPRDLQIPIADLKEENIQDGDTDSEVDVHGSPSNATPEFPLHRDGPASIEKNRGPTDQEEASSVSNSDLLNAVSAFAAEYRTNTRGLLQVIEDLKLSNKKQAQFLKEVLGKYDKYAFTCSNGPATGDLREQNADRTKQHTKGRTLTGKPTRSLVVDRWISEVNPDLLQQPHRQYPGMRSTRVRPQAPHHSDVVPRCHTRKIIIICNEQGSIY